MKVDERENKKDNIKFLNKKRQFDKALKEIDDYSKEYPDDHYIEAYKTMVLAKLGRSDEAIELATNIINNNKIDNDTKAFASEVIAIHYTAIKDYEKAIYYWELCIALSSLTVYTKALSSLSRLYYKVGRKEDAFKILEIDGYNSVSLNISRSYLYFDDECYDDALEALERPTTAPIKQDDKYNNAGKYYMQALINHRKDNLKEALSLYKKVLNYVDNKKVYYWYSLQQMASIYYRFGDDYKAIQVCDEIINKSDSSIDKDYAYLIYANIYIRKFDFEKAYEIYSKCNDDLEKKIGYARIAISKFDFEEALKILSTIETTNEARLYNIYYMYAQIMFRYNNYDKFMEYYNMLMEYKDKYRSLDSFADILRMSLILKKQKNIPINEYIGSYCNKQIMNYNSEEVISHIIERHINDEHGDNFNSASDIAPLFYYVINHLDSSKKRCDGFSDKYVIDLNEIGYKLDGVSYITIVCIANTNHIITMYPSNQYVGVFNQEKKEKPVQKRLSAIEKFNKKYGM